MRVRMCIRMILPERDAIPFLSEGRPGLGLRQRLRTTGAVQYGHGPDPTCACFMQAVADVSGVAQPEPERAEHVVHGMKHCFQSPKAAKLAWPIACKVTLHVTWLNHVPSPICPSGLVNPPTLAAVCHMMQAVMDVKWRRFMSYKAFLACQMQQTRGAGNDKGEASNTAVSLGPSLGH